MPRKSVALSGAQIESATAHIAATGTPLLRAWRSDDVFDLIARPFDDGSFELHDGFFDNLPVTYLDWHAFARQCDADLWHLVHILKMRGYPEGLPDPSVSPSKWPPMDPMEVLEFTRGSIHALVVDRLRDLIPNTINLDKRGRQFEVQPEVHDAFRWLEGSGSHSDSYGDYGMMADPDAPLFVAPSALALSLLQIVLDRLGARVHVRIEP